MVNITLIELHVEDGSFAADLPFSSRSGGGESDGSSGAERSESESSGGTGKAILGVFAFMVVAAALVRYLRGEGDEALVDIDTAAEEEAGGIFADD